MSELIRILAWVVIVTSLVNIIRMTLYAVGADIYKVKQYKRLKEAGTFVPTVSIIIPAHNEAKVIVRTLENLEKITYPSKRYEIIVVDDGSTDKTYAIAQEYVANRKLPARIQLITQPNQGKAAAMNNAIKNYSRGKLIMCLDADSILAPDGITKAVAYFYKSRVVALASNVNIVENGTVLGLVQRFEYLISYNMKKAQTAYNIEYIIGGIGSMFRRDMLELVNYYDTNTMTEDIDLTMKIIVQGNRKYKVAYASDCLTYTEAVPTFGALIKQRYRWKYGRLQTFLKNAGAFFSLDKNQSKLLSWVLLPYALVQELLFLVEPFIVTFIIIVSLIYRDPNILLVAITVITVYILINIWSTVHLTTRDKLRLSFYAPSMYALLYMLSVVEYAALLKAVFHLPKLRGSLTKGYTTWVSPERN